jgi:hypothetical protein
MVNGVLLSVILPCCGETDVSKNKSVGTGGHEIEHEAIARASFPLLSP